MRDSVRIHLPECSFLVSSLVWPWRTAWLWTSLWPAWKLSLLLHLPKLALLLAWIHLLELGLLLVRVHLLRCAWRRAVCLLLAAALHLRLRASFLWWEAHFVCGIAVSRSLNYVVVACVLT